MLGESLAKMVECFDEESLAEISNSKEQFKILAELNERVANFACILWKHFRQTKTKIGLFEKFNLVY